MTVIINNEILEFDWDNWNRYKNETKHNVTVLEAEDAFTDERRLVYLDFRHLGNEKRYAMLAKTATGRLLIVIYTERAQKVRVISARDASGKERLLYEETINRAEI